MFVHRHIKRNRILILSFFFILLPFQGWSQGNVEDSLQNVINSSKDDSLIIDQLNIAIRKFATTRPEITLQYADTAISLSRKINDSLKLSQSFNRKGVSLYYLGDYNGALDYYFQAISIKEIIGQYSFLWPEYNNIGLVLRNLEQNRESLEYFKLALKGVEESNAVFFEATVWNNIGLSHRGLNEYSLAKMAFEKSLTLSSETDNLPVKALCYNNIGNVLSDMGMVNEAIPYFYRAFEINDSLGNSYEQVNNLHNIARSYLNINELIKAEQNIINADRIVNEIGSSFLFINNLTLKSDLLLRRKQFQTASEILNKTIKLKDSLTYASREKQFYQLKVIANTEKKLQELDLLKKINDIQNEKIRNAKTIQILAGFIILIIFSSLIFYIRNNRITKKLNRSLLERAYEVETLNEELTSTNEELNAQRDNLETALNNLEKTQNQLIQSEKMVSLGVLAAGIAHEINNPLNFILGGINAIKNIVNEIPQKRSTSILSLLEIIDTGVNRAAAIVSSLNYYSRKDNLKSETCDIHRIIEDSLLMLNHRIEGRIEVSKELTSDYFSVICNEAKIHQAILNILSNAIDSIEKNGRIKISSELKDQMVWLTIIDNGCGIPNENIAKVTDPFFTTKDPDKGTGLGLAVALKTIQDINGSLEFWSEVRKGTIVQIKLPAESISS